MNKDKSIKDLKQYNDKLKMQYEYSRIRVCHLENVVQRKNKEIEDLKSSISDFQEVVGDYQEEIIRKDNNWNELKKCLEEKKEYSRYQNDVERFTAYDFILNQMKKLEEK